MELGNQARIEAEGENLRVWGALTLNHADGKTEVVHDLTREIKGALGVVLNPLISTNINGQARAFLGNLKNYVEKGGSTIP